jgi:heme exporter protein D
MQFESINAFFAMGGYGLYVWLSFGLGLLSMALLWGGAWLGKKRLLRQIIVEQARQTRVNQARQTANKQDSLDEQPIQ